MESFREIRISSLGELIDRSTPREPDPASGRRRNYSVYRGASDPQCGLLTSLDRLGGWNPPHTKAHLEEHVLRNFIRYAQPYLQGRPGSDWELLITAQHHGVPTRLLDWTYSPLVAAHFATLPDVPGDRVIWQLDWRRIHQRFGLKPLAFLVSDLDQLLREKGFGSAWDFIARDVGEPLVCMLEPPGLDRRIMAQSAAFTLSSAKNKSFETVLRETNLMDSLVKFVIPASRVEFLRDQLDLCSVDERSLFPDLDGVAAEIKRYYAASADGS